MVKITPKKTANLKENNFLYILVFYNFTEKNYALFLQFHIYGNIPLIYGFFFFYSEMFKAILLTSKEQRNIIDSF